jgi:serine kinase of HPr protein (carbohydrate metabolism regulator)
VTAEKAVSNIHATGLCLDGAGIIIRGPSGVGKSLLALELIDRAAARGRSAILVGDDRLDLTAAGDRLLMRAPPRLAGLIELRGRGIVERPFRAEAEVHLVVDLVDELVRMLAADDLRTDLLGIGLARCPVPRRGIVDSAHQCLLIGEAVSALASTGGAAWQKTT